MKTPISCCVYDNIGNLERSETLSGVEGVTNTYSSNPLNQYTNISNGVTNSPTYDDDGNMLTNGDWTYSWNGENRMTSASNGSAVVTYNYDYMGRRFSKTIYDSSDLGSPISDIRFLYDGWAMIQETSSAGTTNSYVYGLDLSGSLQGAGTIGGILSAQLYNPTTSNSTTAFYCYDGNGNVTDLVDSNGNSLAHYEYSPFGIEIASSGSLSAVNPFRFSTKYFDDKTEMNYYGTRLYSSTLARWINRDPIEEMGGENLYGFVRNEPVGRWDLLGREGVPPSRVGPIPVPPIVVLPLPVLTPVPIGHIVDWIEGRRLRRAIDAGDTSSAEYCCIKKAVNGDLLKLLKVMRVQQSTNEEVGRPASDLIGELDYMPPPNFSEIHNSLLHCVGACEMSKAFGPGTAWEVEKCHEINGDHTSRGHQADMLNNTVGNRLGNNLDGKSCVEACREAALAGELDFNHGNEFRK